MRRGVDPKLPILDHAESVREVAACEGLHAGAELGVSEGSAEHVVGSGLESAEHVTQLTVRAHPKRAQPRFDLRGERSRA